MQTSTRNSIQEASSTKTTIQPETLKKPRRVQWDFDQAGCPADQLEHCCFYEYALDSQAITKAVLGYRKNRDSLLRPDDDIGNLLLNRWFGSPFRVLVDHPEFPDKHWLEIDPLLREQKVKQLPYCAHSPFPNIEQLKYMGPQAAHMNRLKAEAIKWQTIQKEKTALLDALLKADEDARKLRGLPSSFRFYLRKDEIVIWRRRLSKLKRPALQRAANELRLACGKKIETLFRQKHELVVYEVDWTLRPEELKEHFGQWAEANRIHECRPRGGGHPTKAVELLKALGAKRLLQFFRHHQKSLPPPYKSQTLHDGLRDFTIHQRINAGRPADPLYKTRKSWIDAEDVAARYLKNFV